MQQECDDIIAKGALWTDKEFNGWDALVANALESVSEGFHPAWR